MNNMNALLCVCTITLALAMGARGDDAKKSRDWITGNGHRVVMMGVTSYPKQLKALPADDAAEAIAKLTREGIYLDPDTAWPLIKDPKTAVAYLDRTKEPFAPQVLSALKGVLLHAKDHAIQSRIAVTLYRYGDNAGRDWLLRNLQSEGALKALAMNQDERASEGAVAALGQSDVDDELILAVAKWKGTTVVKQLLTLLRAAPRRSSRIEAVAIAGATNAISTLEHIADTDPQQPRSNASRFAEAALVRLDHERNKHWSHLKNYSQSDTFEHAPSTIALIHALELSGDREAASTIKSLIRRLKASLPLPSGMGRVLLLDAMESLARIDPKAAEPLAIGIIKLVSQGAGVTDPVKRVAFLLGNVMTDRTRNAINRRLKSHGLRQITQIRKLKKIGKKDLPASSRWLIATRPLH